ncbi:MAG TPA: hypothetical protein V6D28_05275 [Leptolyngbyaceae cyanobacterium]
MIHQKSEVSKEAIAQQASISEAEIIRQAIDLHISSIPASQTNIALWEAEKQFINSIKNRNYLPVGRDWRREDLYKQKKSDRFLSSRSDKKVCLLYPFCC